MDQFEKHFQHLLQYHIIICRKCQFAVIPKQLESHIYGHHPSITPEQRQSIIEATARLTDVAPTPEEVQYPRAGSPAIPGLPILWDGLRCVQQTSHGVCSYVCRERTGIQRHCREQHQWKNPRKRGRQPKDKESIIPQPLEAWVKEQPCQRFFKTGKGQRYFAVQPEGGSNSQQDEATFDRQGAKQQGKMVLDELFARFDKARQEDDSVRRRWEPNPWLEHTGWEGHIGSHKEWVVRMTEPGSIMEDKEERRREPIGEANGEEERRREPIGEANGEEERRREPIGEANGEEERRREPIGEANTAKSEAALEQACKATVTLIRQSYTISRVEIVGRAAMHYVNRRETGAPTSDRPFYGKQKVQTLRRYADQFVKVLRYIWRTEGIAKRPKYRLTAKQQARLDNVRNAAVSIVREEAEGCSPIQRRRSRGRLISACSSFWMAMFDHRLGDHEYESGVLSGLAVLGAAGEDGGWMPAINYTPILAAIITTMRAMVIHRAWRQRQNQIRVHIESGLNEDEARDKAPAVFDLVKSAVEKFMTTTAFGGHPTPINTIYTQKMYGMKIRYTTKAEGQISWEGDDTILVRKVRFSIGDIRSIVHGLHATVRRQLVEDLLLFHNIESHTHEWPEGLPRFDIRKIRDNHRILDEGWNFFKDVRNEWSVNGERWMGQRLFEELEVRQRFVENWDAGSSAQFHDDAIATYLRAVKKFKERLIVLVHMSAGAPARSTELISIQCENGKYARSQRGVFVDNGLVVFVTAYHKGFSASQSMKIVHRFVPREVGEIIVFYLWLIRPFERILQGLGQGQDVFSPWMWEPEPEEEWENDEDADDQDEGYESGEEAASEAEEQDGWDGFEVEEGVEETQPAMPTPEPRNCDGFWNTDRVRRVMRRETAGIVGVPIGISDWRQAYPAIHREFATDQSIRKTLSQIYENSNPNTKHDESSEEANNTAAIRAKQAGHSFQMEEDIYGRSLEQSPFTTIAEKDAFRRVSVDWHRFLQFPSAWEADSEDPDVRRRVKKERDDARIHRWENMRSIDVQVELQRMYHNPRATFRGIQRDALELVVGGCPRAIIIMRTGGGKSLLFMLPAAASKGGVTVVVVPKKALQSNLKQRCIDAGIKCAVWSEGRAPPYDAKIVFAIAESAVSRTFADFINSKTAAHQLERIVIDECHTILQSDEKWRPNVLKLRELAGRSTPVVCLTATLPPQKQAAFMEAMDMYSSETQILRDVTTRPNIAYSVEEYNEEDEDEFVRQLVEQKEAQYPSTDKIVIYCRKIERVKHFAKVLNCTAFWREVGSEKEKEEILEKLTGGEERVFTSTNALGEGIDAPGIRVVIHIGVVDSLDDYGQQSGRAGRDGGTASEAIILRKMKIGRDGRRRPEKGWKTEPEMEEFLGGDRCRRAIMDQYMDGGEQESGERRVCQRHERFCDICRGRGRKRVRVGWDEYSPNIAKRQRQGKEEVGRRGREEEDKQQVQKQFQQEQQQFQAIERRQREGRVEQGRIVEQVERLFSQWRHGCSICRVNQWAGGDGHYWRKCPYGTESQKKIEEIKGHLLEVRWQNGTMCCRACWAPQAVCHSFESIDSSGRARFRQGKGQCQFKGVLREAVAVMLHFREGVVMDWIEDRAREAGVIGKEGQSDWEGTIKPWLGMGIVQEGIEMSGMCYLLRRWETVVQGGRRS